MNRYLCIDNFNGMLALTIGKVYTSTKETEDLIWVINDLGYKEGYGKNEYFIKIGSISKPENYELIYVGELSELQEQTEGETLEAIYEKFNIDHPEDYRGHSLSVSDIVVLHQNGKNSAHFVDSFGLPGLSDKIQVDLWCEFLRNTDRFAPM